MSWDRYLGRRVKLRDLYILMAVAKAGSMGKAAHQLNMSQPAVSNAIADLEHAIGVRLLDRNRQGVEPTPFGRALIARGMPYSTNCGKASRTSSFSPIRRRGSCASERPRIWRLGWC
jgi:molybdenum-dependent DNA-binding transcriptional regulator ModE